MQTKVGLRESSAVLGALVGANFNNDGTALDEPMSALYISQLVGQHLSIGQQLIVILTPIFASVGAANIPNAGLVTMTLVFTSVGLLTQYIAWRRCIIHFTLRQKAPCFRRGLVCLFVM